MNSLTTLTIMILLALRNINGDQKTKCNYGCSNYIKLEADKNSSFTIDKLKMVATHTISKSNVKIGIMKRQKYWVVVSKNWGDKPSSYGLKDLHPNIEEATEWYKKNQCKIGGICPPNGDCWGSWSTNWTTDDTYDWVDQRTFRFKGIQWSTSLHDALTLDWSCTIVKKEVPVHYKSDGSRYFMIDDENVDISNVIHPMLLKYPTYNVFVAEIPKEWVTTIIIDCFKYKKDLLCETIEGGYIIFEYGTQCTILGNSKYCLRDGDFNKVRDFGAMKYASVEDLNQVRDAFVVNEEKDNYNVFLLNQKIAKIQDFVLKIVSKLSLSNPRLLDNVLNSNAFIRPMGDNFYEICPCERSANCREKEFHHATMKFCSSGIKATVLKPFDINATIDYTIGDEFKFQGKEIRVEESIAEKEEANQAFEESHPVPTVWGSLTKSLGIIPTFSGMISYIALGLSIFNFLKR